MTKTLLQQFAEVAEEASKLRYGQRSWKDYTKEEKMAGCNHRTGYFLLSKALNGDVKAQPLYCNLCEDCYARHAEEHKNNFQTIAEEAKRECSKGVWRKKIVKIDKEAGALKKRISRNQGKRHAELACTEETTTIWTLTIDEPGKDMDEIYGMPANPDEIDWSGIYEENRRSGSKVSYGSGLKKRAAPKDEVEKAKIPQPQIIVRKDQRKMAKDIIYRTNLMKQAETVEEVSKNLHRQFYQILDNLRVANVKVIAIKEVFVSLPIDKIVDEWNKNIKSWQMSNDAPSVIKNGVKEDFYDLLYYPAEKKANSGMPSKEEIARIAALNWG